MDPGRVPHLIRSRIEINSDPDSAPVLPLGRAFGDRTQHATWHFVEFCDYDWDRDLSALNDPKNKNFRRDRLPPFLRRFGPYTFSDLIQITIDRIIAGRPYRG